jgi:hypothetical protein
VFDTRHRAPQNTCRILSKRLKKRERERERGSEEERAEDSEEREMWSVALVDDVQGAAITTTPVTQTPLNI